MRHLLLLLFTLLSAGNPAIADTTSTNFWCSNRFLQPAAKPFDARHLAIAKRGYLYAVAAALALQKDDYEGRAYHFATPQRMRLIERPPRDRSGFEAATFEILDQPNGAVQSVVVAFTGSNDDADWEDTNFGEDTRQYTLARRYLAKIATRPEYAGVKLVVSGFSLGGALAVHVTKHKQTSRFVSETWAFNPSPRTYAHGGTDSRIWLASTSEDGLGLARKLAARALAPIAGLGRIGAPPTQSAENYYLLDANPVVSHYRWVLTRNMLHVADLALRIEQGNDAPTEPLNILAASEFRSCRTRIRLTNSGK